jgi:hypothetical protein
MQILTAVSYVCAKKIDHQISIFNSINFVDPKGFGDKFLLG